MAIVMFSSTLSKYNDKIKSGYITALTEGSDMLIHRLSHVIDFLVSVALRHETLGAPTFERGQFGTR